MANKGDKFIIELDNKMTCSNGFVYGVKNVPGLYVDDEIIGYLDKISIKTQYASIGAWFCDLIGISPVFIQDKEKVEEILMKIKNNAMDKMWEMAREIALIDVDCADSLSGEDIQEMFGVKTPYKVFYDFTAQEVVKTIEANEKQSKEFSLWDEVTCGDTKAVILDTSDGCFKALYENGVICNISPRYWQKTGRSFPQIAEVLEEMRCKDE